ncbi:MAG: DUF3185 domain-containing protein [Verrucomicrobiota bacterium]
MKTPVYLAIALIIIGIVSFAYQGITYKTREKTVDLGPLQISTEQTHTIPLPPILGALTLTGGIVLLVINGRRS